jgi:sulfur-oxidizing protein SoxZ
VSIGRISVPRRARRGEIIEIRLLLQHSMENGFRRDPLGQPVPKNVIHTLVASYAGRDILRAELGSGIAANPYLSFHARATESGEISVDWIDDAGERGSLRAFIEVD